MAIFRRLVWVALCAGLISGAIATVAHQIGTVPLILEAETYEKAGQPSHAAGNDSVAWEPENGTERTAYTLLADLLTGIGFALVLAAGLTLRGGEATWRDGLFWGLAGFAALTLAPSIGLPPQLPGVEEAALPLRQLWWLAAVLSTGCGLALLAFTRRARWAVIAVLLMTLPHLYGAPQPNDHAGAAPAALARQFVVAVTVASFVFWTVLGATTGYFYRRFGLPLRR
jgi:cobalt transporter subunit CbtA